MTSGTVDGCQPERRLGRNPNQSEFAVKSTPGFSVSGTRNASLTVVAVLLSCGAFWWPWHHVRPAQLNEKERAEDFDEAWDFVRELDCWLPQEPVDWTAARAYYRPRAIAAVGERPFAAVLEEMLDELHDGHTHLDQHWDDSWYEPPEDIWAEWQGDSAIVREVRAESRAARAGVKPGDVIVALNGVPIRDQVAARLGHCQTGSNSVAQEWALLSLIAGRRDAARCLTLRSPAGPLHDCSIPEETPKPRLPPPSSPVFTWRRLPGNIGYMHFTLFDDRQRVEEFDAALAALRDTRGLILDVRYNWGGNTGVAEPIMGRFISQKAQYVWMAKRQGAGLSERWPIYVRARGPWTYTAPLVVLVNHWSESMAEGVAIGLDGMKRARVVGTRMAGMGAGVEHRELPNSGIVLQVSAEPVYHVNGTPRSDFRPPVAVRLDAPEFQGAKDPILDVGIAEIQRLAALP
jgi:carboxyl-terminal processing protease